MARSMIRRRIDNLRKHLQEENPDLVGLVDSYGRMDQVLHRMRLLDPEDTLTNRIGWWPVVSLVGLYSSGKSTLINDLLGLKVQRTGNQAVDDKFTVLCHGTELRELPGTALDVDPRFPFHAMGDEIEKAVPGEGKMVNRFLALKTVPSEQLKGMILVDSPGFDSDEYRAATLRLIDHILDLSDLTLVVFDARKPEPGVMRDTLEKLVARIKDRADANKFLFVLNQIDATSREDNLEEVVGAWQRALASVGITGGRFYSIYSTAASTGSDIQIRLQEISRRDTREIRQRIHEVPSVRGYRVANSLEAITKDLREDVIPGLTAALGRWRKATSRITWGAIILALVAAGVIAGLVIGDPFANIDVNSPWFWGTAGLLILLVLAARWIGGKMVARRIARELPERRGTFALEMRRAFLAATSFPLFLRKRPVGWSKGTDRKLDRIHEEVAAEVRRMNDRYARPGTGSEGAGPGFAPPPVEVAHAPAVPVQSAPPQAARTVEVVEPERDIGRTAGAQG
ncbi:dynamin family protein [Indioceanicola profundi]|uniref:dynamin family protein n=1 Tax=Indioceanicola profundi TaxID=2220096 RepID=UPI000E6ACBF1|nr:dynamin family protein [Indioceanicola profundi]